MAKISPSTKQLIEKFRIWQHSLKPKEGISTIHVDEVASKVAAFYEKIRTIIDWKEEHLMRRAAITRKLKGKFLNSDILKGSQVGNIAEPLVLELIRGGHLPNDKIEESKIKDVQRVIDKYALILRDNPENEKKRNGLQFYNWILGIAACEIEETLAPSIKETALMEYMFAEINKRIKVHENIYRENLLTEEEKGVQIYIAVQQALFKLDEPIISYNIIKYRYPYWINPNEEQLVKISQNIHAIRATVEKDLNHPLGGKFHAICEKYNTPYILLGDILAKENLKEIESIISNPETFERLIHDAYQKRLSTLRTRLYRAALYSTLSIFLGNSLSFIILEVPLARLITGSFSPFVIMVDILGPTLLMFLLVVTIEMPPKSNARIAVMETIKIAYQREKTEVYEVKKMKKRGLFASWIIALVYFTGAVFSFGLIYLALYSINLPPTSVIINIVFISLIVFAGLVVRKRSKELTIEEHTISVVEFFFDILALPVASVGKWLSNKWKQYNAIAAFFNALIDMPFSVFVEFLEGWRYFIKERKEDIR